MIGSRRTLLTAFAGLAATAIAAPGFAGNESIPVQFADARAAAPNFVGISKWFNSAPLSIGDLRGKVVLVDFWTYGCYNCVNTLPLRDQALRDLQGEGACRRWHPHP
jgi:thiol-disulfide isomerase/thioredoxin